MAYNDDTQGSGGDDGLLDHINERSNLAGTNKLEYLPFKLSKDRHI